MKKVESGEQKLNDGEQEYAALWRAFKAVRPYILLFMLFLPVVGIMAGCGEGSEDLQQESPKSEYIYIPEYFPLEGTVESVTVYEGELYYCTSEGVIRRRKLENDAAAETVAIPEFDRENYEWSMGNLQPDREGNLYLIYRLQKKNSADDIVYLAKYDMAGRELFCEEVSGLFPHGMDKQMAVDEEGHLFVLGVDGRIFGFDRDCTYGATFSAADGEPVWGLTADGEGKVFCAQGSINSVIRSVSWEEGLSDILWENLKGVNEFSYYREGEFLVPLNLANLYLYNCAEQSQSIVLTWADCGIEPARVQQCVTLEEDRILVFLREYMTGDTGEVAVLTRTERSQVSQKETITLGTFLADSNLQRAVARFNRRSEEYRLEVKEYYDLFLGNGGEELENARTALHLDIVSGRCPDILNLEYEDLANYTSKGLLADLTPYMQETDLELLPGVAEAYTYEGKLVSVPQAVQVRTLLGRSDDIGAESGWSLEEMMGFIDSHSGEDVFDIGPEKMLEYCLLFNQSAFIDWERKTCDFTSEEFYQVLELSMRFKERPENAGTAIWGIYNRKESGKTALLYEVEINNPYDIVLLEQILGTEKFTFVGFPTLDGSPGHLLEAQNGSYSIHADSRHKEAAWEFIELLMKSTIAPQSVEGANSIQGFPSDHRTREAFLASAMEEPYERFIQTSRRRKIVSSTYNGHSFEYYVPRQEDMEPILELLDTARIVRDNRRQLLTIIKEEAAAYFDGQKSKEETAEIIQNRISVYLWEQG